MVWNENKISYNAVKKNKKLFESISEEEKKEEEK